MKVKNSREFFYNIILNLKFKNENKIFTHLTGEEKIELYRLAKNTSGIYVEIGSYLGASANFIARGIYKNKTDYSLLYCVDTWKNEEMSEGKRDTYEEFLINTKKFKDVIHPLRGYSVEIAKAFVKSIDFLFIDGDHRYEGVNSDVQVWLPKLKQGGIIIFHDIKWANGVKRTVQESIKPIVEQEKLMSNLYWAKVHRNS